jgi:tyrosyl-tRNA synthetase
MTLRGDFEFRGLVHQSTDESVLDRLGAGSITVYAGFDPTAASLHLGHLLQICTLRRMQLAGNRPIALAGGGTGLIGDPSFKAVERPLLSLDELAHNVDGIREQLSRFLDFTEGAGSSQALLLDNSAWLTTISLTDFLRDVGKHFTVNQMIAKDSVKSRLDRADVGLSYTEFSYMLLQAYDFYRLHVDHGCTLQIGGSDQWGNIVVGVELIRKMAAQSAYGMTSPLLLRADGQKFGKSEAGNERVWLDASLTSPFQLYQFLINSDDATTPTLLRFFTFLSHEEISALDSALVDAPQQRVAQRALASEVVTLVHGETAAVAAQRASEALFSEEIAALDEVTLLEVVADAPSSNFSRDELRDGFDSADLLVRTKLANSKAEARRFLDQRGVYLNNVRLEPTEVVTLDRALHGRYLVLRRGRHQTHLVVIS